MNSNNSAETQSIWTGSFVKICLVNLFVFVNFHALLPTFPFFVTSLGGDAVTIGVATALFSLASIVSRPFVGWLADTRGRRAVLLAGLVGLALLPMGYFASAGIALAVVLRTLHGGFHAASSNATNTWVADMLPPARMGEGLGMYGLSMAVSTAVAPALGLLVMNKLGFDALFVTATSAALLALGLTLAIKTRAFVPQHKPLQLSGLFERMSLPASITQFFFMMAFSVVEVYVAIYAAHNGLPSGGLYFAATAVATVITRVGMRKMVDQRGEGPMVYSGNMALVAALLLLVGIHTTWAFVLSGLLSGYAFGAVQPSLQTMAMHAVAPQRRGAAASTFFVAFDLAFAIGCMLAGVIIERYGYDCMFVAMSGMCVVSAVYYTVFARHHASSMRPA